MLRRRWPGNTPLRPHTTTAFYVQAAASFGVSIAAAGFGIAHLPLGSWVRAFLAVGMLCTIGPAGKFADPDAAFEWQLQRVPDGLAGMITGSRAPARAPGG